MNDLCLFLVKIHNLTNRKLKLTINLILMETLNQVLKVLFQEVRSEDIISLILSTSGSYNNFDCLVKEDIFVRQLLHVDTAMTLDHAEVVYHVLHDEWAQPNIHDYVLMYSKKQISLIYYFIFLMIKFI